MTQTFGQLLVNEHLPNDLKIKRGDELPKKELYQRIYRMVRSQPKVAADRINRLRSLGHEIATAEGVTIGLDDITPDYKRRDPVLKTALKRVKQTSDPKKRIEIISNVQEKLLGQAKQHPGSQGLLVRAGAKGKPPQLMRTVNAAVHARGPGGTMSPWLIHHSHSEGLRPSEMFIANVQSRNDIIESNLAVTEPGDVAKILVNNMSDQLVLESDCGTHNGVAMRADDPNVTDRYLARSQGGFPRNTLITPQVAAKLGKKMKTIMVRSPMTCEMNEGVCQKCYGLNEYGQPQRLGTNVGMRSAQALTEPLTQFVISAKHGLATVKRGKQVGGLKALRQFLEVPKSFINKATVAYQDGKVTSVEKAPQGGMNVFVDNEAHYVPAGLEPIVRKGDTVTAGDALSEGTPMPNEVVAHKGLGAGRKYVVDHLHDIYQDRGVDIDKRHLEILARAQLNHVRIEDDPNDRFYPGEVVNYTTLVSRLAEDVDKVPVKKAKGEILAKGYGHYTAGTRVTDEVAADLKKSKITNVEVAKEPPRLTFLMKPISRNPLLNPDWMARLGHRYLKDSVLEGAHFAESSDLQGAHPIPAYVHGISFGKGPGGRY